MGEGKIEGGYILERVKFRGVKFWRVKLRGAKLFWGYILGVTFYILW